MTESDFVTVRESISRKLLLLEKFGTLDGNMAIILNLAMKQLEKEGQDALVVDAYMDIISYWKNRCEKIMAQSNADIEEIIKLTRGVARRSSVETDGRLAEFIKKGDEAVDFPVAGGSYSERKDSLRCILDQQKKSEK